MSVIAWDGKTLAADRQANDDGMRRMATKLIVTAKGEALAWTGDHSYGLALAGWYTIQTVWPTAPEGVWARLVVVRMANGKMPDGSVLKKPQVVVFENMPVEVEIVDDFMAWGSGRDFAMGAMAMGAGAVKAVEVACQLDTNCGMGVDSYDSY